MYKGGWVSARSDKGSDNKTGYDTAQPIDQNIIQPIVLRLQLDLIKAHQYTCIVYSLNI